MEWSVGVRLRLNHSITTDVEFLRMNLNLCLYLQVSILYKAVFSKVQSRHLVPWLDEVAETEGSSL